MIRKFKLEDLNDVMAIWLQSNMEAHDFIPQSYWQDNFEMVKEMLPQAEIYVYEQECIQGFIGIMEGYIAGLFVRRADRSRGIGQQLVQYVKKEYNQLTLNVYEKNEDALAFYEKQDFECTGKSVDVHTNEVELAMRWEKR